MSGTIYMPSTAERPVEPAPYVLTEEDVIRFLRSESADPYQALYRLRQKGLKAVPVLGRVRYLLPDVLAMLDMLKEGSER